MLSWRAKESLACNAPQRWWRRWCWRWAQTPNSCKPKNVSWSRPGPVRGRLAWGSRLGQCFCKNVKLYHSNHDGKISMWVKVTNLTELLHALSMYFVKSTGGTFRIKHPTISMPKKIRSTNKRIDGWSCAIEGTTRSGGKWQKKPASRQFFFQSTLTLIVIDTPWFKLVSESFQGEKWKFFIWPIKNQQGLTNTLSTVSDFCSNSNHLLFHVWIHSHTKYFCHKISPHEICSEEMVVSESLFTFLIFWNIWQHWLCLADANHLRPRQRTANQTHWTNFSVQFF